jgi:hypothetical protein
MRIEGNEAKEKIAEPKETDSISKESPPNLSNSNELQLELEDAKSRIKDLEKQINSLTLDLKHTVITQKETGANANEALRQLESEIDR